MGRKRMEYTPEALVCAVVLTEVAVFSAVTVAPEMTAPLGSVTSPVIVPVTVCPKAGDRENKAKRQTPTRHRNVVVLMEFPLQALSGLSRRAESKPISDGLERVTLNRMVEHCQE
jgi:hypothetical protein